MPPSATRHTLLTQSVWPSNDASNAGGQSSATLQRLIVESRDAVKRIWWPGTSSSDSTPAACLVSDSGWRKSSDSFRSFRRAIAPAEGDGAANMVPPAPHGPSPSQARSPRSRSRSRPRRRSARLHACSEAPRSWRTLLWDAPSLSSRAASAAWSAAGSRAFSLLQIERNHEVTGCVLELLPSRGPARRAPFCSRSAVRRSQAANDTKSAMDPGAISRAASAGRGARRRWRPAPWRCERPSRLLPTPRRLKSHRHVSFTQPRRTTRERIGLRA
mmetsp:Transcript_43299/g.129857  ORF Transcript_43299/g.129857 Transcript_43299/m.129857 type:complete len:273 (-) Transcript_43299:13-831(-)